MTTAIS
jgi:hypothetical protein